MSLEEIREKCCICSAKEIYTKKPSWICSCTAGLYKTKVLKETCKGKKSQKKVESLDEGQVFNFKVVSSRKLDELWERNPYIFQELARRRLASRSQKKVREEIEEEKKLVKERAKEEIKKKFRVAVPRELSPIKGTEQESTMAALDIDDIDAALMAAMEAANKAGDISTVSARMRGLQDVFKYHGFDVEHIRKVFIVWFSKLPESLKVYFSDNDEVEVSGTRNLPACLSLLAFLYNFRGNNTKNILLGLDDRKKAGLSKLLAGLHIKDKVLEKKGTKESKSRDTLTLSRICAAFPLFAMKIAVQPDYDRKVVDLSDVGIDQSLPVYRALCHPLAASMLSGQMKRRGCIYITFLAAVKLNNIIGPKGVKTDASSVWTYHKAVLGSKAANEEQKVAFWASLQEPDEVDVPVLIEKLRDLGASEQVCAEIEAFE